MNAAQVVNLLLELNIIGTDDIDQKLRKIAARISNPDAKAWFLRVPRYFLINLDKQAETPYTLPKTTDKYLAFKERGNMGGGSATNLHRGDVEQEIDRTFTKFDPNKPAKKPMFKGPPAKDEVTDWMKAAKGRKEQLYHYDPFNRDKISFERLEAIADYLNYIPADSPILKKLRTMKTSDIEGFREVSQAAQEWRAEIDDKPWRFGDSIAYQYGRMRVISCNNVEESMRIAKGTVLCTRMRGNAEGYLKDGLLFYVYEGPNLYGCVHVQSNQARNMENQTFTPEQMKKVAPLFKYIPLNDVRESWAQDIQKLRAAVAALPEGVEPVKIEDEGEESKLPTKVKKLLPPWNDPYDDPAMAAGLQPKDTGYRQSRWESLVRYVAGY